VNDPLVPQTESMAARRTRLLAPMATSRSAPGAKNQARVDSEAPSSAQLTTAIGAQFAHASPLTTFLASPNAPVVTPNSYRFWFSKSRYPPYRRS